MPDICTLALLVDGQEIPRTFKVRSLGVHREINRIPSASIDIDEGAGAKGTFPASDGDYFLPGNAIEIRLGYRSKNQRVFKGTIIKQRIRVLGSGSVTSIECFSDAFKMTNASRSIDFVDLKDSDIMESILDAHGLPNEVEMTTVRQSTVVQYDSTDWNFLLCRAEANGQVVIVFDDKVKIAKPIGDGSPALQMPYGSTILEFDGELDAQLQRRGIRAVSWKAADQDVIGADGTEPTLPIAGNVTALDLAKIMCDDINQIAHRSPVDVSELQAWADARLLRMRMARLRGRAKCKGFAGILPGDTAQITGIGARFEGTLYVSGVHHSVLSGNWETEVQLGLAPELFTETSTLQLRQVAGLPPTVSGLQIGIVTALEGDPDREGRIKCRLPLGCAADDGIWTRMATLDAGNDRGTFFRPEIGDEVIVGFVNADPRFPVILGMCHSSAKPAPEPADDDNGRKGYVSREKLKLIFDDSKNVIVMGTPKGNKIVLSEDAKGIVIQDQNGNKIVLDDNGITISSVKDLVLNAVNDIK